MIRPEIQFNEQLTRYQRECESEEKRAAIEDQRIDYRVQELLAFEGDCYPWSTANIFEALTNMGQAKEIIVGTHIAYAKTDFEHEQCSKSIRNAIKSYWQEVAQAMAEDGK